MFELILPFDSKGTPQAHVAFLGIMTTSVLSLKSAARVYRAEMNHAKT